MGWIWDPSLYAGSAEYYARGRISYPVALADALAAELGLDGSGRLLDVGCGPGSLTLVLAGHFREVTGIDADPGMVAEAARRADAAGVGHARWMHLRAEELPAGLGRFELVTFAQSFHWLDRPRVAATVRDMLTGDGVCAHVHAETTHGTTSPEPLPHPRPPHAEIGELVREYLGPVRRAGQGQLPDGTPAGESEIYRAAGFTGPGRVEVPGRVVTRVADDVVAGVYSLSSSAPHLFGDHRARFEADLRQLLHRASPDGLFSEQTSTIAVDLWRR
ncbi:class I SAM-dependent methyltransferase [Amycolatopsis albispora]|uniref:Methyltransferase n=1 Tax=Amycolatopsis albispora TaxID=1804986 RepID=A0A344L188_9PSEU|nr:class I SAM-dependent methyltransferase [Amycolatopsis albispora]AXB41812.1 methyltransferase [Amycolatopsis albispora]